MARFFDLVKRAARALHPFVLVTTRAGPRPLDTDVASRLADRLWEDEGGRELATRIHHAVAIRGYLRPEEDEGRLLAAITEWVEEVGEEAAGRQVLDLQAALRADPARGR